MSYMRDGGLCRQSAALCNVFLPNNRFSTVYFG